VIFDNSKIRQLVPQFRPIIPFWQGAREIIAWYDADVSRQVVDPHIDEIQDRLVAVMKKAVPLE
jgi:hypothetical protein